MAKKNVELKQETLRRIRAIIDECGGVKKIRPNQLRNNKQYLSIQKSFMNGFERRIADEVIGYIYDGKTDDEIQLIYRELRDQIVDEMSDEKSAKIVDEMEQATEAMFIKSKNKVVDGPIIIDTTSNVEEETDDEDAKGLFGKFVSSTVDAGLNDAKDKVEEAVNEITKIAKEKIDDDVNKGENKNGMLILSKGAVVDSDGTEEKIAEEPDVGSAFKEDKAMTSSERFDMMMEQYRQPLIDKVGFNSASHMLTPPVNWDKVIDTIENGPFCPLKFITEGVARGITTIIKPFELIENKDEQIASEATA